MPLSRCFAVLLVLAFLVAMGLLFCAVCAWCVGGCGGEWHTAVGILCHRSVALCPSPQPGDGEKMGTRAHVLARSSTGAVGWTGRESTKKGVAERKTTKTLQGYDGVAPYHTGIVVQSQMPQIPSSQPAPFPVPPQNGRNGAVAPNPGYQTTGTSYPDQYYEQDPMDDIYDDVRSLELTPPHACWCLFRRGADAANAGAGATDGPPARI